MSTGDTDDSSGGPLRTADVVAEEVPPPPLGEGDQRTSLWRTCASEPWGGMACGREGPR